MSLEDAVLLLAKQEGRVNAKNVLSVATKEKEKTEADSLSPEITEEHDTRTTYPKGWDDQKLVNFHVTTKKRAKDERAYKEDIRSEVWDLYNGLQDFSQKADWQTKETRAKVFMMVETVMGFIQLGLFKLRDWFDVVPVNKRNQTNRVKAFIVKQILKFYATDKDFIYEVLEALKWGFLSELFCFKVWEGEEKKYTVEPYFTRDRKIKTKSESGEELPTIQQKILRRRRVMYSSVNPSMMLLDYSGHNKFKIETGKMDFSDYIDLVNEGQLIDHIEDIQAEFGQKIEDVKEKRKREQVTTPPSTFRKEITYDEFWGPVWDNEGKSVYENIHYMIVNEKWVVLKPEPIIFFDGEDPYIVAGCISVPGSVYHKSLIEPIAGMAKLMTEVLNLTFDAVLATILNIFELDVDRVLNISDLTNGIGPNTVIQKRGPEKVLEVTQAGKVAGEAFVGLEYLQRVLEEDTAITRGMIGVPQTGKRQTKGEVQQQAEFSSSFFQAFIQNIENNFLAPILEKIWYRVLQFPDELSHPKLADLIGEEGASMLNKMTAEERYDVINGDYEIKVTGLSGLIAKKEMLNNIITFTRIIARSQEMMAWIEPQKFLSEVSDLLNIDPMSILRDKPAQPVQPQNGRPEQPSQPGNNGGGQNNGMNMQRILQMIAAARGGAGAPPEQSTIAEAQ